MSLKALQNFADSSVSRRGFLKGTGALVVGFSLVRIGGSTAEAQRGSGGPSPLDGWLKIAEDNTVTAHAGKVDLGTGIATALRQIVAEELGVSFAAITWIQGDTAVSPNQGYTVGSASIRRGGVQLRQAAATARHALMQMAAERLDAPIYRLVANDGAISIDGNPSTAISYGELIGGQQFEMAVDEQAPVKDVSSYTIVGQSIPRVDVPEKVVGTLRYVHNVRLPGMLHARVIRTPTVNATLANVDESSISDIPAQVFTKGNFLAVVAEREEHAMQAAGQLAVEWTASGDSFPSDAEALSAYMRDTEIRSQRSTADEGDPERAMESAARTIESTFEWPFQLHAMIGPSCAVADVSDGKATIYSGTQGPHGTQSAVANILGFETEDVRVIYHEGAGCYGRLSSDDAPLDAALLSQALGRPVRVQWTRQEEHAWEPKGPPHYTTVRAGLDEQGNVVAWDFLDRSLPWVRQSLADNSLTPDRGPSRGSNGSAGGGEIYAFANIRAVAAALPWDDRPGTHLRTTALRAPGDPARTHASETFMDELAVAAGVDPVEYRYRHLSEPRMIGVLRAAADASSWYARTRPGRQMNSNGFLSGRGVALADRSGTMIATVADVEVDPSSGKVWVRRITAAHDCGLIVNPDGVSAQVEGNVIQATSRALMEEVVFNADGVTSVDWA
ncbi:MAG: molybdopterin cofactor-binding domain-containing protein, partial [Trueperaceae bacterium]